MYCPSLIKPSFNNVRQLGILKNMVVYLENAIEDNACWSISDSFVWAYTPQGNDFWYEHHKNSYDKGYLFRRTTSLVNLLPKNNNFII